MERKKIFVIDDDVTVLRTLEERLKTAGFDMIGTGNPLDALTMAHEHHPDLIILDIVMPQMSGYELLDILKKDPSTKGIPVIILTVKNMAVDIEKGLKLGAGDYITKPLQMDLMIKRIERLL